MKACPEAKESCPCEEYSKEGLCDWPYRKDMTFSEIAYMTELLRTVGREGRTKMPTTYMLETAREVGKRVLERLAPYCKQRQEGHYIEVAGSVRRRQPRVHDVDIVLVPGDSWNLYQEILALNRPFTPEPNGPKVKGIHVSGMPVDLYIADVKEWATLLLIRTGSVQNNVRLCKRAQEMGWTLHANGSGLFNERGERIAGDTELSIYNALGLKYQEPWERG